MTGVRVQVEVYTLSALYLLQLSSYVGYHKESCAAGEG